MERERRRSRSRSKLKKRRSLSRVVRKRKPLKIDCTSLLNHLKLIQQSVFLRNANLKSVKPNVNMYSFQSQKASDDEQSSKVVVQDWYILVASTPYAISAQLVSIPTNDDELPDVVVPDFIHCTPISVWTCQGADEGESNTRSSKDYLEILSCDPRIIIQEPANSLSQSEYLQVAIVCGTDRCRVLSMQLSIFAYVGIGGGDEGRYVLSKTQKEEQIVEPLKLDSEESIAREYERRKREREAHKNGKSDDGTNSVTSASRDDASSSHSLNPLDNDNFQPFCPQGGVQSISSIYKCQNSSDCSLDIDENIQDRVHVMGTSRVSIDEFLWVTYGDGTFVRMPKWAFFGLTNVSDLDHPSQLYRDLVFKGRLDFKSPPIGDDKKAFDHVIVPFPRHFQTLLSQPADIASGSENVIVFPDLDFGQDDEDADDEDTEPEQDVVEKYHEFFEALCYKKITSTDDKFPTLAFYTNEDQLSSNTHNEVEEEIHMSTVESLIRGGTSIIGGTASMAKSMLGGMIGVFGYRKKQEDSTVDVTEIGISDSDDRSEFENDQNPGSALFPILRERSTVLFLGTAHFDPPRKITNVSIDPHDGSLAACADNFGRVQLIDLETKETIRLWKGFREATCHWIVFPYTIDDEIHMIKYLAIHSRQRNVVEIFRMNTRIGHFDVKSDGVSLVQCPISPANGDVFQRSFELRLSRNSTKNSILKEICVVDDELIKASRHGKQAVNASYGETGLTPIQKRAQEVTIQMQQLKQLISSESAIPSQLMVVYETLTQITALSDLSKALDLLALSTRLSEIGATDSCFHSEVVLHARDQLDSAMEDDVVVTSKNAHIEELSTKIDLHTQLILAYDEIHEFENSDSMNTSLQDFIDIEKNSWVEEATSWRETFEKVTSRSMDAELPDQVEAKLSFATFAKGCIQDGVNSFERKKDGNLKISLCDSTRDRKQILLHVFKPLTKDVFSSKTTHSFFESLRLNEDFETLEKYYGEWFMTLPIKQIEKQCHSLLCPLVRWLHDLVLEYIESDRFKSEKQEDITILGTLLDFCSNSEDLVRSFYLATACHEAITVATGNIEDRTYGLFASETCVEPWKCILRKLRTGLLVSLRLHGIETGTLPVTVSRLEDPEMFSIHQLLAYDELSITSEEAKITLMESICAESEASFVPSTENSDATKRWQQLQLSCVVDRNAFEEDDTFEAGNSPLLFYFLPFLDPIQLASHRALILAQRWSRNPYSFEMLENSISALRSLEDIKSICTIGQTIWNNHVRPIIRGSLFGFHEVDEVCEDIVGPLCDDEEWYKTLNKVSSSLLSLLRSSVDANLEAPEESFEIECDVWPPIQKDIILSGLTRNATNLDDSSLEVHGAVLCALQLTDDFSSLPECFPTLENLFLRESLAEHQPLSLRPTEAQALFIDDALRNKAISFSEVSVNYDDLDDLVVLGRAWGSDKSHILTEFLIIMYELGKEEMIQHLMTSTRLIDIERFQDGAMAIACVRLDAALATLKKAKKGRSVVAMLDPDTCDYVKEHANLSKTENPGRIQSHGADGRLIPLAYTQDLILRMKRMNSANRVDAAALSIMCETMLRAADVF